MTKRVLVTGVRGFIGSHFVGLAKDSRPDWELVTLTSHRALAPIAAKYRFDLCDRAALSGVCEGIDCVVNFAAKTFVDHSIVDPYPFVQSNFIGVFNLLEDARRYKVPRFIQVSTDEVYGPCTGEPFIPGSPVLPSNPYAATKAAADALVHSYRITYGMDAIVTRTVNNYGPGQHRQKAIPTFIRQLVQRQPVTVYGDGLHRRRWLHVSDHCSAIRCLVDVPLQSSAASSVMQTPTAPLYHIDSNVELSNLMLVRLLAEALGVRDYHIQHIEDRNVRPGHDRRYALAAGSTPVPLGWEPSVPLRDGLAETVRWFAHMFSETKEKE